MNLVLPAIASMQFAIQRLVSGNAIQGMALVFMISYKIRGKVTV